MRRLLALLGALVMVGAAIGIRALIDDGTGGGAQPSGRKPVLLCATDLEAACRTLAAETGIRIEIAPAGDTVAELSALADADRPSVGYDGWLTFARDVEIVRDARERNALAPILGPPQGPLARSPLVLAVWHSREQVLARHCGGSVTWRCVGDVADTPWSRLGGEAGWGDVKPGHDDPATTGEGLAVIGQAAAQWFGRNDLSLLDYEDDGFLEWFSRLERAVPTGASVDQDPFERMLAAGPAAFDVVATTEAGAGPTLARASRDRRTAVTLLYPAPVASADVVFAPVEGAREATALQERVTGNSGKAALARAGWRVDGEPRARGIPTQPPLAGRSNLPSAGALEALLDVWQEVTR